MSFRLIIGPGMVKMPALGTAARANIGNSPGQIPVVPVPMSSMSAPVKATIDGITAKEDSAAFHDASEFATAEQLTDGLSSKRDVDTTLEEFYNRLTTSSASASLIRSVPIPANAIVFIDAVATFQETVNKITGGYIWATLAFSRASGAPIPLGTVDILQSHNLPGPSVTMVANAGTNAVDIYASGRNSTSLNWGVRTKVDRGNP